MFEKIKAWLNRIEDNHNYKYIKEDNSDINENIKNEDGKSLSAIQQVLKPLKESFIEKVIKDNLLLKDVPSQYNKDFEVLAYVGQNEGILHLLENNLAEDVIRFAVKQKIKLTKTMRNNLGLSKLSRNEIFYLVENGEVNFLQWIPDEYQNDKEMIFSFLKTQKKDYLLINKNLRNDFDFNFRLLKESVDFYYNFSDELKENEVFVELVMKEDKYTWLPEKYQKNKIYAKKILEKCGLNFKHLDKSLKSDEELIDIALESNRFAIKDMPDVRADDEKMKKIIDKYSGIYQYGSVKLREDFNLAKRELERNFTSIKFVEGDLKDNFELFLEAVKKNGAAIEYSKINGELRKNLEIAKIAVRDSIYAYRYFSEEIKSNPLIIDIALKNKSLYPENLYKAIPDSVLANSELAKRFLPEAARYIWSKLNEDITENKELVLSYLEKDANIYVFLSEKLKKDNDIILKIIEQHPYSILHLSEEIVTSKEFLKKYKSLITENKDTLGDIYEFMLKQERVNNLTDRLEAQPKASDNISTSRKKI